MRTYTPKSRPYFYVDLLNTLDSDYEIRIRGIDEILQIEFWELLWKEEQTLVIAVKGTCIEECLDQLDDFCEQHIKINKEYYDDSKIH